METTEHRLLALAAVLILGTASQWLAWRLRLPSILLLLACGVIAGPVTGWVRPDALLGDLLFPIVSLSVAVILFEGSLALDLRELRDIGPVLVRMLSIGVIVTWGLTTAAAYGILGFSLFKSLLLGAVLVVTGPTVIGPLLRHIRPLGRVGPIARWEGIVIDPLGAVLALLVYEVHAPLLQHGMDQASWLAFVALIKTLLAGGGLGSLSAWLCATVIRRHYVPDHLQSVVVLMLVLATFVAANALQAEAGLLAVTVMGVVFANIPGVVLQPILEFKENLSLLLIASLFILLSARLDPQAFMELGWRGPAFVAVLILVVRPAAVLLSTLGTRLRMPERLFLAWLAPRGIVAAAVTSVFALKLGVGMVVQTEPIMEAISVTVVEGSVEPDRPGTSTELPVQVAPGRGLVPATFLVIIGTVVVYGLTAAPLARKLGLASADPQGVLIAGADLLARQVAHALQEAGYPVLVVDTNRWNVRIARLEGLPTAHENILSEQVTEDLDLGGIGRLLGMTSNDEVNSLAALQFAPLFGRANVYQLTPRSEAAGGEGTASHLRARTLFGPRATHAALEAQLSAGGKIKATKLTDEFNFDRFRDLYDDSATLLFISDRGRLQIVDNPETVAPKPGQTVIALISAGGLTRSAVIAAEGPHPAGRT